MVDEWGFWEATLTFEGAPVGEAFTIEVAAPDGTIWAFPFIVGDPAQGTCWGNRRALHPGRRLRRRARPLAAARRPEPGLRGVGRLPPGRVRTPSWCPWWSRGSCPPRATHLAWDLSRDGRTTLTLDLYSLADPVGACAQVLTPFTEVIALGEFAPGSYVLVVNGVEYPFEI